MGPSHPRSCHVKKGNWQGYGFVLQNKTPSSGICCLRKNKDSGFHTIGRLRMEVCKTPPLFFGILNCKILSYTYLFLHLWLKSFPNRSCRGIFSGSWGWTEEERHHHWDQRRERHQGEPRPARGPDQEQWKYGCLPRGRQGVLGEISISYFWQ